MHLSSRIKHELTGRRLLWNLFFYVGHILIFLYGWQKQARDERLAALNKLQYSVWISRGAGLCLGIDGLFIVLPMLRNMIRLVRPVLGWLIPLDEHIWMHRQFAYSLLFWTIVHTTAHYVNMIHVEQSQVRKEAAWAILFTQPGGFTGHLMLVLMLLVYTTAHAKIRQHSYEAFWYTHHLVVLILFLLYIHAIGCFVRGALPGQPVRCLGYYSWTWTIWGGIAYVFERFIREVRGRRKTKLASVLLHPQGALELRFVKPSLRYKSGQWLFLSVPSISPFQWHPFTISSAPSDPYISVHVRQVGDWTKELAKRLRCSGAFAVNLPVSGFRKSSILPLPFIETESLADKYIQDGVVDSDKGDFYDVTPAALAAAGALPEIRVDGPFGAPTQDVFNAEVAVLVAAGIGITPFASVLKNIWYMQQQNRLGALRRVHLIWIVRDTESMGWFNAVLRQLEQAQSDPDFLRISLYLTQRVSPAMLANIAVHATSEDATDAITGLNARTQFGRPDFDIILDKLRLSIEKGCYLPGLESTLRPTVGVFYCGPDALAKELKTKVKRANSKSVRFTFRKEHF
ncbi:hypothetical protein JCM10908_002031 [Rhodotorula pacifica]|uniref:uncharacterized protein n=1 Tax=Rhodotorula pacifica TaxID=1495444 RepID=UPI003181BA57